MIINVGFGTLLAALGATPVSILPPIMLALGYSSFVVDRPAGDRLRRAVHLRPAGHPGRRLRQLRRPAGRRGGRLLRPLHAGDQHLHRARHALDRRGAGSMICKGLVPGVLAGADRRLHRHRHERHRAGHAHRRRRRAGRDRWSMLVYLQATGQPLFDRVAADGRRPGRRASACRCCAGLSPWIILTAFALLVNAPSLPFFELTFKQLAMPVEIIPGAPEKLRLFWQAYFWILVSTLLALPFLRPTPGPAGARRCASG